MTSHPHVPESLDDTDRRLAAAAAAGDDGAFSALAARHRSGLQAHCRQVLRSAPDADDAVQEALLRAWRRRGGFEGRSSFGWWLRCIATNACLDVVRRGARSSEVLHRFDTDSDVPADEARTDPATLVTEREAVEHAYLLAIRVLPPRQRRVLVLRDVLRYSAADTAELLGATVASVNSALQRARATLAGGRRGDPTTRSAAAASAVEREIVGALVDAHRRADVAALVAALERVAS